MKLSDTAHTMVRGLRASGYGWICPLVPKEVSASMQLEVTPDGLALFKALGLIDPMKHPGDS